MGSTDTAMFDNPSGASIWGDLAYGPLEPGEAYRRVFDFGCGCGRNARQLLMQDRRPERYVGVDLHRGMIRWCRENLHFDGVEVSFHHHDVWNLASNPDSRRQILPLVPYGDDFTLVNAHSVFTHLYQAETEFYLRELAHMVTDRGLLRTTWFLFNREWFPVLAPHQNCLYVNEVDPTQAVYYDWGYLSALLPELGLKIVAVSWTQKPGFQTDLILARGDGFDDLAAPDLEPPATILGFGSSRPPAYHGPFETPHRNDGSEPETPAPDQESPAG